MYVFYINILLTLKFDKSFKNKNDGPQLKNKYNQHFKRERVIYTHTCIYIYIYLYIYIYTYMHINKYVYINTMYIYTNINNI